MTLSLADLSSTLLSWVLVYGAIVLFVAVLLGGDHWLAHTLLPFWCWQRVHYTPGSA